MKQFIVRYFSAKACGVAFFLLLIGIVLARVSVNRGEWSMAYLQGLSTTFAGLSLEILLINFLLELQRESLGDRLRKTRETAISEALKRVVQHLDGWIPKRGVLEPAHIPQLECARSHVDKLRESGSELAIEVHDTQYRQALEDFTKKADELCDKIEGLVYSIHATTTTDRRTADLNEVLVATDRFKQQAEMVLARLPVAAGPQATP